MNKSSKIFYLKRMKSFTYISLELGLEVLVALDFEESVATEVVEIRFEVEIQDDVEVLLNLSKQLKFQIR